MSDWLKLSQTFKSDWTLFCNQIGVLQQPFREPLWKSVNLSSTRQRGGGLDVWQMWLRLAEAGRRAAQPQTPTETVREWATAEHTVTLTSLTLDKDTHSQKKEETISNIREWDMTLARCALTFPHTLWNIQTLCLPLLKHLVIHLFTQFVPRNTNWHKTHNNYVQANTDLGLHCNQAAWNNSIQHNDSLSISL